MRFKGTGNVIHLESNFFLNVESEHRAKKSQNMHLHLERTQDAVSRKKKNQSRDLSDLYEKFS